MAFFEQEQFMYKHPQNHLKQVWVVKIWMQGTCHLSTVFWKDMSNMKLPSDPSTAEGGLWLAK